MGLGRFCATDASTQPRLREGREPVFSEPRGRAGHLAHHRAWPGLPPSQPSPYTHRHTRAHTDTSAHARTGVRTEVRRHTHTHDLVQLHWGAVSWSEPHSFWCEWTKPTLSVPRTRRPGVSRPLGEGGSVTIEVLRPCPPPSPPGTQTARQGCEAEPSSGRIRCCTGGPG